MRSKAITLAPASLSPIHRYLVNHVNSHGANRGIAIQTNPRDRVSCDPHSWETTQQKMQELQEREKEKQKWRDLLANTHEPTPEERTEHVRKLQFEQGVGLFAVAYSTLHKAACDGNVDGLKWFLTGKGRSGGGSTGGKVNVDDFDAAGMCAIHYAAERGHDSSVEFLLKRKCAIDVESGNGNTSLHYAAAKNKCSTIRLCHERGANLLARNKAGLTAAHFAANSDHIEALEVLV